MHFKWRHSIIKRAMRRAAIMAAAADPPSLLRGSKSFARLQLQLSAALADLPATPAQQLLLEARVAPLVAAGTLTAKAKFFWLLRRRFYQRQAQRRALRRVLPLLRLNVARRCAMRKKAETVIEARIAPPPQLSFGPIAEEEEVPSLGPSPRLRTPPVTPALIQQSLTLIKRKLRGDAEPLAASQLSLESKAGTVQTARLPVKLDWSAVPRRVSCWLKPATAQTRKPAARPPLRPPKQRSAGISSAEVFDVFVSSLRPKVNEALALELVAPPPGIVPFDLTLSSGGSGSLQSLLVAADEQYERILNG